MNPVMPAPMAGVQDNATRSPETAASSAGAAGTPLGCVMSAVCQPMTTGVNFGVAAVLAQVWTSSVVGPECGPGFSTAG